LGRSSSLVKIKAALVTARTESRCGVVTKLGLVAWSFFFISCDNRTTPMLDGLLGSCVVLSLTVSCFPLFR